MHADTNTHRYVWNTHFNEFDAFWYTNDPQWFKTRIPRPISGGRLVGPPKHDLDWTF